MSAGVPAAPSTPAPRPDTARRAPGRGRPAIVSLAWTVRDYAKRVWDNSAEDNVLFLAGGVAFNILLAAVPFLLLLIAGLTYLLPLRYFLVILRGIFLKGIGLEVFWPDALALLGWGLGILALATLRSTKRLA